MVEKVTTNLRLKETRKYLSDSPKALKKPSSSFKLLLETNTKATFDNAGDWNFTLSVLRNLTERVLKTKIFAKKSTHTKRDWIQNSSTRLRFRASMIAKDRRIEKRNDDETNVFRMLECSDRPTNNEVPSCFVFVYLIPFSVIGAARIYLAEKFQVSLDQNFSTHQYPLYPVAAHDLPKHLKFDANCVTYFQFNCDNCWSPIISTFRKILIFRLDYQNNKRGWQKSVDPSSTRFDIDLLKI